MGITRVKHILWNSQQQICKAQHSDCSRLWFEPACHLKERVYLNNGRSTMATMYNSLPTDLRGQWVCHAVSNDGVHTNTTQQKLLYQVHVTEILRSMCAGTVHLQYIVSHRSFSKGNSEDISRSSSSMTSIKENYHVVLKKGTIMKILKISRNR